MKTLLFATVALMVLPICAIAQSNDSMSSGTSNGGAMATGTATDASPAGTSMSGSPAMSKLSLQDTHFIKIAAIAGMAEVSDGQLAQTKGDTSIKQVGSKMVADHTKANDQLMAIAQAKGVTPPAKVDPTHAAIHTKLAGLSGAAFDSKYLKTELTGHEMTIAAFKTEASIGSDPQLKSFASATLPTLKMHLAMIKAAMK